MKLKLKVRPVSSPLCGDAEEKKKIKEAVVVVVGWVGVGGWWGVSFPLKDKIVSIVSTFTEPNNKEDPVDPANTLQPPHPPTFTEATQSK